MDLVVNGQLKFCEEASVLRCSFSRGGSGADNQLTVSQLADVAVGSYSHTDVCVLP